MNSDFDDDDFDADDFDDGDDESDEDEEYQAFLRREFPDQYAGGGGGGSSLPSHWKWTAWGLLALLATFWLLSLL